MSSQLDEIRAFLLKDHWQTVCADRLNAMTAIVRQVVESQVDGAFVEVGCYKGAMSLWVRALLDELGETARPIHVYDSFSGLPEPGPVDSDHLAAGELLATPADVTDLHARWAKRPPAIHPGWFHQTLPVALPDKVAFAYLDGDFYESIMDGLRYCVPRLAQSGVILVDDYADLEVNPMAWNGLPGVKRACDDYFGTSAALEVIVGDDDLAFGLYRAAP